MARRKSKLMEDGFSSDSSDNEGAADDDYFDPDDPEVAAERELFQNPYQRGKSTRGKKRNRNTFDDEEEEEERSTGKGKGKANYTKIPTFVSASTSSAAQSDVADNLSIKLPLPAAPEAELDEYQDDDEEVMDVDNSSSEEEGSSAENEEEEDSKEYLAPIPGLPSTLHPPPPPSPPPATSSLGFAPRGMVGSKRGGLGSNRNGIGGAGIGSRAGVGGGGFKASTAASENRLGELGKEDTEAGGARAGIGGGGKTTEHVAEERSHTGIRGGIGASFAKASFPPPYTPSPSQPTTEDDSTPTRKRSFLPSATSIAPAPAPLSKSESAHFRTLASSNNIGFKLLQKAGWKVGEGLGADGRGIVTPIGEGAKARKKGEGIRKGERTKESRREEARRLGKDTENLSSDSGSDTAAKKRKQRQNKEKKEKDSAIAKEWQNQPTPSSSKSKKSSEKTTYKTYEELLAEAGGDSSGGVGLLIDLSGNALSNQSLSSLPTAALKLSRLPELLHNLTLLSLTAASALTSLTREGVQLASRQSYNQSESCRVRKVVEDEVGRLERLEGVLKAVGELEKADGWNEIGEVGQELREILGREEWVEWECEALGVGAVTPLVRKLYDHSWNPLEEPTKGINELKAFKRTFVLKKEEEDQEASRSMSPWESLLWTVWLPKVRSALNNHWLATTPSPALALLSTWASLLPAFIHSNLLDQLIFPKVSSAISDWSHSQAKEGISLGGIIFPWLELNELDPERMEGVLEEGKRKIASWIRGWKVRDGFPSGLSGWKQTFEPSEWTNLLLKHVLPKLGAHLSKFLINPRAQDLKALEEVLEWEELVGGKVLSELLEIGWGEKWLEALWVWLCSEGVRSDQVAEWYSWWKGYFVESVRELESVKRTFRKGLDLMNQAMALGDDAKYRLKKPSLVKALSSSLSSSASHRNSSKIPKLPPPSTTSISFRSIVSDICESHNLLFLPLNKATSKGHAMYRVSETVNGKNGITIFLESDVVWIGSEEKGWQPAGVEQMIQRAGGI